VKRFEHGYESRIWNYDLGEQTSCWKCGVDFKEDQRVWRVVADGVQICEDCYPKHQIATLQAENAVLKEDRDMRRRTMGQEICTLLESRGFWRPRDPASSDVIGAVGMVLETYENLRQVHEKLLTVVRAARRITNFQGTEVGHETLVYTSNIEQLMAAIKAMDEKVGAGS